MFYKIGDKYYVRMKHYYQEVEVIDNNIVPKKGEATRIYFPILKVEEIYYKDLLKVGKTKSRKSKLQVL